MARIRTIKPDQPKDEELALLPIATRYLFAFLPTLADRMGRLEDRPRVIKLAIFPWDDVDVEKMLVELSAHFLVRYSVGEKNYLQIKTFCVHQKPHPKEADSTIPPPSKGREKVVASREKVVASKPIRSLGKEYLGRKESLDILPPASAKAENELVIVHDQSKVEVKQRVLTAIQRVVNAYKEAKGVGMEDKAWDKENFARCSKPAKSIIECIGSWESAAVYVIVKGDEFDSKGLDWTLETIKKHAWDNRGKLNGRVETEMGNNSLPGKDGYRVNTQGGKRISTSGEILAKGFLGPIRSGDRQKGEPDTLLAREDEFGGSEG